MKAEISLVDVLFAKMKGPECAFLFEGISTAYDTDVICTGGQWVALCTEAEVQDGRTKVHCTY